MRRFFRKKGSGMVESISSTGGYRVLGEQIPKIRIERAQIIPNTISLLSQDEYTHRGQIPKTQQKRTEKVIPNSNNSHEIQASTLTNLQQSGTLLKNTTPIDLFIYHKNENAENNQSNVKNVILQPRSETTGELIRTIHSWSKAHAIIVNSALLLNKMVDKRNQSFSYDADFLETLIRQIKQSQNQEEEHTVILLIVNVIIWILQMIFTQGFREQYIENDV